MNGLGLVELFCLELVWRRGEATDSRRSRCVFLLPVMGKYNVATWTRINAGV